MRFKELLASFQFLDGCLEVAQFLKDLTFDKKTLHSDIKLLNELHFGFTWTQDSRPARFLLDTLEGCNALPARFVRLLRCLVGFAISLGILVRDSSIQIGLCWHQKKWIVIILCFIFPSITDCFLEIL